MVSVAFCGQAVLKNLKPIFRHMTFTQCTKQWWKSHSS